MHSEMCGGYSEKITIPVFCGEGFSLCVMHSEMCGGYLEKNVLPVFVERGLGYASGILKR